MFPSQEEKPETQMALRVISLLSNVQNVSLALLQIKLIKLKSENKENVYPKELGKVHDQNMQDLSNKVMAVMSLQHL